MGIGSLVSFINILPLTIAIKLTQWLVIIYLWFKPNYRKEITANYQTMFELKDKLFWIKNSLGIGKNLALMLKTNDKILDNIIIYGENTIKEIMKNSSCIIVSFHFGPWELLPKVFSRKGYHILLSVQRQSDNNLNQFLEKRRGNNNVDLIYNFDVMQKKIHNPSHKILGYVLDNNNSDSNGKFLTDLASSIKNRAPFTLARRYSLPIVPMFIFYQSEGLKIIIGNTIASTQCQNETVLNIAQQFLPLVTTYPEQWVFWGK